MSALLLSLLLATQAVPAPAVPQAPAASAPAAADLLAKIRKTYTASPSVSATFVESYAPAGFAAATPETGHVTIQAPDQIRFDYDGSEGKIFTFDGKAGRQYVAADKQLVLRTLAPGERERLPIVFLESPEEILGRYEASVKPALPGVFELTLAPRGEGLPTLELLVTETGEVKRLVVKDPAGNRTTFTFTQKTAGRKRPPTDFALVPPAGTKVIE